MLSTSSFIYIYMAQIKISSNFKILESFSFLDDDRLSHHFTNVVLYFEPHYFISTSCSLNYKQPHTSKKKLGLFNRLITTVAILAAMPLQLYMLWNVKLIITKIIFDGLREIKIHHKGGKYEGKKLNAQWKNPRNYNY